MKKSVFFTLLLYSFGLFSQEKTENPQGIAQLAVDYIINESYEDLNQLFSEKMGAELTSERIKQTFSALKLQYGAVQKGLEFKQKVTAEATYYEQGIAFEKENFSLLFSLNEKSKMQGFRLVPYSPTYEWQLPEYASLADIKEKDIIIEGEFNLLGKLTAPTSKNMKLIIVFVHGSGPNDMDESLGPNKLFKDLAYGLASNNIASIRYNKVSYDYPSTLAKKRNEITIEDIVVNDAISAIKKAKELGAKKVILLGHSLGGHMVPMIANKEAVDGVILMAGNASPLYKLLVPQYEHLMKNDPNSGIGEFQLNAVKSQVKNVEEGNYNASTPSMTLPLGLPASFWLSLQEYEPVKLAKEQTQPYLILNGGRDYQVTTEEAKKWKNGNKNKLSKTIIYPKLNHMFFEGEGVLLPNEYEIESHLQKQVLQDIINWSNSL